MATPPITPNQGSTTRNDPTTNSVYTLLETLALQDIKSVDTGELLANVFDTIEIGNGQYIQDIIMKMAKNATSYDKDTFFNDVHLNKPEFVQWFVEAWNKYQYNIGYNRKDLASALAMGKSEEAIKTEAVGMLAKKKSLDDVRSLEKCITDTNNKVEATYNASSNKFGIPTFKAGEVATSKDLKGVVFNIRNVINYLARFNGNGIKLNKTNQSVADYDALKTGLTKDDIVVCMSESASNVLDTYLKTGVYNLQYLYDNYKVVMLPDSDMIELEQPLNRIFVMDKRHIIQAVRDEIVETQYDVPSQTFGAFYTVDKLYATSPLYKAVYFDCANISDYLN